MPPIGGAIMADRSHLIRLQRELAEQGMLIEAGWISLRLAVLGDTTTPEQLRDMRMAYFAGAQHLFGAIATIMEPGEEPTEADLTRMDRINAELTAFLDELKRRIAN
jgi:hypothetical protein